MEIVAAAHDFRGFPFGRYGGDAMPNRRESRELWLDAICAGIRKHPLNANDVARTRWFRA